MSVRFHSYAFVLTRCGCGYSPRKNIFVIEVAFERIRRGWVQSEVSPTCLNCTVVRFSVCKRTLKNRMEPDRGALACDAPVCWFASSDLIWFGMQRHVCSHSYRLIYSCTCMLVSFSVMRARSWLFLVVSQLYTLGHTFSTCLTFKLRVMWFKHELDAIERIHYFSHRKPRPCLRALPGICTGPGPPKPSQARHITTRFHAGPGCLKI